MALATLNELAAATDAQRVAYLYAYKNTYLGKLAQLADRHQQILQAAMDANVDPEDRTKLVTHLRSMFVDLYNNQEPQLADFAE